MSKFDNASSGVNHISGMFFVCEETVRRSKRNFTEVPEEELRFLERAVELSPEPQYSLHLAKACGKLVVEGLGRHDRNQKFTTSKLHKRLMELGDLAVAQYR